MKTNELIKIIAGAFVVISVSLGYYVSSYWFLFTIFVGLNLIQSSFTNWCLLETILVKFGVKKSESSCTIK